MSARATDPLDSARRWLSDCLASARRWQETEAPPKAPAYLPAVITDRLRASVRAMRQLRKQKAKYEAERDAALLKLDELTRQLRAGPVTQGHRDTIRRTKNRAERHAATVAFYGKGIEIAQDTLNAAAERVARSILAAGARLNQRTVKGRPMPQQAHEIEAERWASRRAAMEAKRQEQRKKQAQEDALLAMELARTAKARQAALEEAKRLAAPQAYPCARCTHGKPNAASDVGWECTIAAVNACKPWMPNPARLVVRDA